MGIKRTLFALIGSTIAGFLASAFGAGLSSQGRPVTSISTNALGDAALEEDPTNVVGRSSGAYKKAREARSSEIKNVSPTTPLKFAPSYSYPRRSSSSHGSHRSHSSHRSHRSGR